MDALSDINSPRSLCYGRRESSNFFDRGEAERVGWHIGMTLKKKETLFVEEEG